MVVVDNAGSIAPAQALAAASASAAASESPPGPSLGRLLMDFHSSMRRLRSLEGRGDAEAGSHPGRKNGKAKQPWEQGNSEDEANDDDDDEDDHNEGKTSAQKLGDLDMRMSLDSGYNDNDIMTKTQNSDVVSL